MVERRPWWEVFFNPVLPPDEAVNGAYEPVVMTGVQVVEFLKGIGYGRKQK